MAEEAAPWTCSSYRSGLEAEGDSGDSVQGRDSISRLPSRSRGLGGWVDVYACVLEAPGGSGEPKQISLG